jgi:hypothetical protein
LLKLLCLHGVAGQLYFCSKDLKNYNLDIVVAPIHTFNGRIASATGGCISGNATNYVVYA